MKRDLDAAIASFRGKAASAKLAKAKPWQEFNHGVVAPCNADLAQLVEQHEPGLLGRLAGAGPQIRRLSPPEAEEMIGKPLPLSESSDEAAKCIRFEKTDSTIAWNLSVDNPIVSVRLVYRNLCQQPVHARIIVSSGHGLRDATSLQGWRPHDTRMIDRRIKALGTETIEETLGWFRVQTTMLSLSDEYSPISSK